jgi:small ligand-binding sensory domain FIST
MKKLIYAACIALASLAPAHAENLDAFGLETIEAVSETEAATVRGQGATSAAMSSFQIFAFDYVSGSSLNLQSSNISLSDSLTVGGTTNGFNSALTETAVGMSGISLGIDGFVFDSAAFEIGSIGGGIADFGGLNLQD